MSTSLTSTSCAFAPQAEHLRRPVGAVDSPFTRRLFSMPGFKTAAAKGPGSFSPRRPERRSPPPVGAGAGLEWNRQTERTNMRTLAHVEAELEADIRERRHLAVAFDASRDLESDHSCTTYGPDPGRSGAGQAGGPIESPITVKPLAGSVIGDRSEVPANPAQPPVSPLYMWCTNVHTRRDAS